MGRAVWAAAGAAASLAAHAQGGAGGEDSALRRDQLERIEQWRREHDRRAPQVGATSHPPWRLPVAGETPCFVVREVRLVADTDRSPAEVSRHGGSSGVAPAESALGPLTGPVHDLPGYEGRCLGSASIEALRANLEQRLIDRGYITSSLSVPPQDLGGGTLRFAVAAGRVEAVVVEGGAAASRPAANALALRQGDVLSLRDIEQTVENLARLPSQSSRFVVEPGTQPGASVVRILPVADRAQPARQRAWMGVDSNEGREYGEARVTLQASIDAPLLVSDQFAVYVSRSQGPARGGSARPLQSTWHTQWDVPIARHSVSVSYSRAEHRRFIAAGVAMVRESGHDATLRVRWQGTAWRGATGRLQLWAAASERRARSHLEDIELLSRRRLATAAEQGAELWLRGLRCDTAIEAEGAQVQRMERDSGFHAPLDGLPRSWQTRVQWGCRIGPAGHEVTSRASVQRTASAVDGNDLVVLGSRQTVRAHAGADALHGTGLTALRHEWLLPARRGPAGVVLRPSVALDWGRVHRPLDGGLRSRELAAAVFSVRAQGRAFTGDLALLQALSPPPTSLSDTLSARRRARLSAGVWFSF